MTLRSSRRTSLELRVTYSLPRFTFEEDDSIPHQLVFVSSDVHKHLQMFLTTQEQFRNASPK